MPLILSEGESSWARKLLKLDPQVIVWGLSPLEVRSALARRLRDRALTSRTHDAARARADRLFSAFAQVLALESVRERAVRLLDRHPLRAADALQLAAALTAARDRPHELPFLTLDRRLADAARGEGFPVEGVK